MFRNKNANGVEHNKGFVIYAGDPECDAPTDRLRFVAAQRGGRAQLAALCLNAADHHNRVVHGASYHHQRPAPPPNNNNADDNAVFRLNAGYQDWNGNGSHDIPYTNGVSPGYEEFVTTHQPLANTANSQGLYEQAIDANAVARGDELPLGHGVP